MTPREIDLATIRTWPAAVTVERDGWFYLASGGVTGRVNAAWPLDWRGSDLDAAIDDVEAWYEGRNLPPRFKLTDNAYAPQELPQALMRRGYQPVMPTLIMLARVTSHPEVEDVTLDAGLPAAFDAVMRETSKGADEYDERLSIALRAPQPAAFATLEHSGRVAAIGMCASAGALAGVFLMRTAPEARRLGHARSVLRALMARCAEWGARHVFLQVDADNQPAIALYEREGFSRLSTYRFWRKA